ncbi:MAG: aspartate dehydrogenase [Candidatus Omnitrophica bacterium]|nr:aspartate dehydrogenase [Candidatus Omnitrophota bacterium]
MVCSKNKIKVGIIGCGAIGSGIAKSVVQDLRHLCEISGLYDLDQQKVDTLEQSLNQTDLKRSSLEEILKDCDLMVEAVNATNTQDLIRTALTAKKDILVMSVGKLLNADDLFSLAAENHVTLLIPTGAIAGIDAIKAASLAGITKITLTTRKPPAGLSGIPYIESQGIDLDKITGETVIFDGDVTAAVKHFPQNINVAATLALACNAKDKLTIRIISSPTYTKNSHEIEAEGDFGRIVTLTENIACPDNPKTSYLAVLSGIQALKDFCQNIRIGT